ncbi:MAG: 3-dehydroquinate synthase [candidate division WS1 bacterium]|nr:3-dehydroquinate synthase [candidate division WS1 bacterium]
MRLRPPARTLALVGFMGSGKSATGAWLADRLRLPLIETDELIEQAAGKSIARIFAEDGETAFRELETAAVRQATQAQGAIISAGGGAVVRQENMQALQAAGPVIWLQVSAATVLERTQGSDRPLLQVPDPGAEVERLLAQRTAAYAHADAAVPTDGLTPEQVGESVFSCLGQEGRAVYFLGEPVRVPVALAEGGYEVHVGPGLLARLGELIPPPHDGARAAVIADAALAETYAATVREALHAGGWEPSLHLLPSGEASKNLAQAGELSAELAAAGHDRGSWVFAVGGGVTTDLGGFVAAIFMRGLSLVTIPTSLLAQVDAAVGGKVAVNLPQGKNLVGAFHQPRAVVADVEALKTLPAEEWAEGLAEVIKHATIADLEMFQYLEHSVQLVRQAQPRALQYLVARNCQIKAEVVARDPQEQNWRAVLNFGHTVGHAVERASESWGLGHGAAVALGMVAETRWAEARGLTPSGAAERLSALLTRAGLPSSAEGLDLEQARQALRADKKLRSGKLALPVLTAPGEVRLEPGVSLTDLEPALDFLE